MAAATWTDESQGARIKVFPTGCGRRTAWLTPRPVFRAALAIAEPHRPVIHRRSLYDQFRCHAVFAPVKTSWNLETWRPVVSAERMVRALCNPTGRPSPPPRRPPARPRPGLSLLARVTAAARLVFTRA